MCIRDSCRPAVGAGPVQQFRGDCIHLGCPGGARDGGLSSIPRFTELQEPVPCEIVGFELPEQLLLCSQWHCCYDHGVMQIVPGELKVCFRTHATNFLIFQEPSVQACQSLAGAQGICLNLRKVSNSSFDQRELDVQTLFQCPH